MKNTTHANQNTDETNAPVKNAEPQSAWLNGIPAVARHTQCSRRTIQNWISSGELPVKRLSSRFLLIRRAHVDELIDRLAREFEEREEADTTWCEDV